MPHKEAYILIVDDEIVIREMLAEMLTEEGYVVDTACGGDEALSKLRSNPAYDVLFTDISMPHMDGITLVREARKVAPTVVPIIMTGYGTLDTARAAVKEGAYDYIVKPFNLSEIRAAVANALERSRLAGENARLKELTELFKISENIASIHDEDILLEVVLQAALDCTQARRGSIMIITEDGQHFRIAKSRGLPETLNNVRVPITQGVAGWVVNQIKPVLTHDITKEPHLRDHSLQLPSRSFISVPLERKRSMLMQAPLAVNGERDVLAVLNVSDKRNGLPFTEGDLKALSILANHAAAALENVRLIREIEDAQREIVFTLGEIVESRSRETGYHVKRVAEYSKVLALGAGLTLPEAEIMRLASPLHDVGKVGIPDAVLNKPGRLTPEEFAVIQLHAQLGFDMLKNTKPRVLRTAAIIALTHHEKFDGSGYPRGLSGRDIPLEGRIVCIADVFDALGVERVYKPAWSLDQILDYFRGQTGKHFDPDLVEVFFANLEEILEIRNAFPESEAPSTLPSKR